MTTIMQKCQHDGCDRVATFHVRVPLIDVDSYELAVCDEHMQFERANGAEVLEWLDRPRFLEAG